MSRVGARAGKAVAPGGRIIHRACGFRVCVGRSNSSRGRVGRCLVARVVPGLRVCVGRCLVAHVVSRVRVIQSRERENVLAQFDESVEALLCLFDCSKSLAKGSGESAAHYWQFLVHERMSLDEGIVKVAVRHPDLVVARNNRNYFVANLGTAPASEFRHEVLVDVPGDKAGVLFCHLVAPWSTAKGEVLFLFLDLCGSRASALLLLLLLLLSAEAGFESGAANSSRSASSRHVQKKGESFRVEKKLFGE